MTLGQLDHWKARGRRSAETTVPTGHASGDAPDGRTAEPATPAERRFLPEVQGLRALAVLMVVAYHVWFGRISGGVDVFLLISAFLLTGQFTRKLERGVPLALFGYWVRLFKRLLPLLAVTVLGVLVASYLLLSPTRWHDMIAQAWASLLYYQNWFLAAETVDYYATDHSVASPLQHFWSLSIQGQIFILWPLVFALAAVLTRRARHRLRPVLLLLFGTIFAASLWFSITSTASNQAFAYFDTRARLWEFALGSLVAVLLPSLRLPRGVRLLLGWVGVVGMLACGLVLQVGAQFPGYLALWPTLSAAAVIAAGATGSRFGADRLLSWAPLVSLGNSSYALYLIHWPVLIFVLVATGRTEAGPLAGAAVVAGSLLAAWLATRLVDTPLRRSAWLGRKRRRALSVIAVCVACVAAPLVGWQQQLDRDAAAVAAQPVPSNAGAAALRPGYVAPPPPDTDAVPVLRPALTALDQQWVFLEHDCEGVWATDVPILTGACASNLDAAQPAARTIVVVGDSHAEQWMGALLPVAEQNQWRVVSLLQGGCDFGDEGAYSGREESCVEFNMAAAAYLLERRPDAVFTMATDAVAGSPQEQLIPGYATAVTTLSDAGIDVIGVRDNPRFLANQAVCVGELGEQACGAPLAEHLAAVNPAAELNDIERAYMLDLTESLCGAATCSAVVEHILVYLDDNHLSWDYATSMAPDLARQWRAATGWTML